MAITVSAEFKALWEDKQGQSIRQRVGYKRRYSLAGTYYNESAWAYLYEQDFQSLGSIAQQSDVRGNIIKTSIMSLRVPNENNQWIEHASSPSFYAADGVATDGYKAVRTLWQLQEGMILASGSIEWITVFTGIQLKKPKITGKGESAVIEISSNAALLERADAEEVCTEPGLENCIPATGDGTNVDFESTSVGVDHAKLFEVNGVNLTQGSAWRVSNDNEIASAGNTGRLAITAATAPTAGHTVKTSVKKWLVDQLIETLVGLLCDEGGVGSAVRSIAAVIFPGSLSGSKTIDTQADWEAGTVLTNIDTTTTPGSISPKLTLLDDFSDLDYTASPVWTKNVAAPWQMDANSGYLQLQGGGDHGWADTPFTQATGTVEFKVTQSATSSTPGDGLVVLFASQQKITDVGAVPPTFKGYGIFFDGATGNVYLSRFDTTTAVFPVNLATLGIITGSQQRYTITRTSAGLTNVWLDGLLVATVTDNTYTTVAYFSAAIRGASTAFSIDDIKYTSSIMPSGVFESAVQDILSTPTAWGVLQYTETLNGGTITYATASSADGLSWDAYVDISSLGFIQSALKRYFKVRATFASGTVIDQVPVLSKLIANFSVSTVNVSLANHRGNSCLQQIENYIKLADYEMRFKGDGTLVVGPKSTASYVVHLTQENAIIDITDVDYGIPERVVRAARIRYNGFVSVYGDVEAGASASVIADGDELGKAVIDESLDEIIVANDVNLGISRARVLYDNNRRSATDPRPRVRMRLKIWDVQWLEVSDVVRISFYDHPLLASVQANDELLVADSPYLHMGAPGNVISSSKDWRVIYYNPNKDIGQADILVEEVI